VMRAKGIAQSRDGARWLVERVGRRISITPLPASEEQEPTDLVVITVSTEDVSGVRPAER
jgi:hypothetical protein